MNWPTSSSATCKPMNEELKNALEPLVLALVGLDIPYRIVGSVASSAQGMLRATLDVDLVVQLEHSHILRLVARLGGDYYADPEGMEEALARGSSFNLIHLESMIKLDLFPLGKRKFDQVSFARVQTFELTEDFVVNFKTPEDVILGKLEWFEAGERTSERQWRDIGGLLKVQGERLDLEYMRHWASILQLVPLLEQALAESGL